MKAKFKVTSIQDQSRPKVVEEKGKKKVVTEKFTQVKLDPVEKGEFLSPINLRLEENTFEFGMEYDVEVTFKKSK